MPRRRRERFVPNVRARLVDAGILQHTTPTRRSNPSLLALGGPDHRTSAVPWIAPYPLGHRLGEMFHERIGNRLVLVRDRR